MTKKIDRQVVVWGAGSWGTALALHLSKKVDRVALWVYDKDQYMTMKDTGENPDFLPG